MSGGTARFTAGAFHELPLRLVLASASPRRAEILRDTGFEFVVDSADIHEPAAVDSDAREVASRLALAKAEVVAARNGDAVVVAADTVVEVDGWLAGKPVDAADAVALLRQLAGREHRVTSGVAAVAGARSVVDTETTIVKMRAYSEDEIRRYVESGLPMDKAGAYGIQDSPFSPAEWVRGCYLNVVGLPLCLTMRLLREIGVMESDGGVECPSHDLVGARA